MKKNRLLVVVLLVFTLSTFGCALKYMKDWTPKQRAIYAEGLYIKQWDAYIDKIAYAADVDPETYADMVLSENQEVREEAAEIAKNSNLTEAERRTLRAQKKALIQMERALDLYEIAIETGKQPSPELEKELISLSNQLESWLLAQPW